MDKFKFLQRKRFGEKEEYMNVMNEFLQQHWDEMRDFLQTTDTEIPMSFFDGYVDLPLCLAVVRGLLVDIIYEMDQRLEDFIIQSQDQKAMLQAEVTEIRNQLSVRDEQLASATFRLGVIEEEREEGR